MVDGEDPAHCEDCQPWAGGMGCYKVVWGIHGKQTNKQDFLMASASVLPLGTFPAWVPSWFPSVKDC